MLLETDLENELGQKNPSQAENQALPRGEEKQAIPKGTDITCSPTFSCRERESQIRGHGAEGKGRTKRNVFLGKRQYCGIGEGTLEHH